MTWIRPIPPRWLFGIFLTGAFVDGCLRALGNIDGSPKVDAMYSVTLSCLFTYAIYADPRSSIRTIRISMCGAVFFFWPVVGPAYLIQTRGWGRGLGQTLLWLVALVAAFGLPQLCLGI